MDFHSKIIFFAKNKRVERVSFSTPTDLRLLLLYACVTKGSQGLPVRQLSSPLLSLPRCAQGFWMLAFDGGWL